MVIKNLQQLFTRDLTKLKEEIALYNDESIVWKTEKNISNSAGNLCLHLLGNLNTFIGAAIGETGYIRNRPEEFTAQNIPREVLIKKIEEVIKMVQQSLDKLTLDKLEKEYPIQVFGEPITYELFLLHLSGHLMYHLGQINYHRRLLDRSNK
ncbi:MAG: DinB family protein [Bacteroidota bacterium]|nr:DinB family protein [Bacteroidota bacterium]